MENMNRKLPPQRMDYVEEEDEQIPDEIAEIDKKQPIDEYKADDLSQPPKKPKEFRLSLEEMELCMLNLQKDEDRLLFHRVVAGQKKDRLLTDYIKSMNPE